MTTLAQTLERIQPVNNALAAQIQTRLDNLTKPRGSLGRLEEIVLRYACARGTVTPTLGKKRIVTFAADHGVAAEGVSAFPAEVTTQMVRNMLAGGAAVNVLARHVGAEVCVVDIGVNDPLDEAPGLLRHKIASGSVNIARGPAMSVDQCHQALTLGIKLARTAAGQGVTLLGTGEMGIGNTTPSAALFAALLPCKVDAVTGLGTGITVEQWPHKQAIVQQALCVNADALKDPLATLAALGGYDIAGICGLILGAAAHTLPVVVDGFISTAGALVACKLCPAVQDYLFFSHLSAEAGHRTYFFHRGIRPLLDLEMRLGEGTGAALAMSLIEAALKTYLEMATFDSAGVVGEEVAS